MAENNSKCHAVLVKFLEDYSAWLKVLHECSDHQSKGSCQAVSEQVRNMTAIQKDMQEFCGVSLGGLNTGFEPR